MINLRKNDALADAVKEILQQEALKGNQHKIDKNKNNEVDPEDFKILRGEKKAVKEEETVEEGLKDMVKKAFKLVTGGSDEDQRKNLQGKMGLPQTGKKPTQKEEVEQVDEVSSGLATSYLNKREPQHKPDLNSPETNNRDAKVAKGISSARRRALGFGPDKNAANKVTGRSEYRKNVGATHTFNKEEVEIVYEANIQPTSAKSRSHIGNLSNPTVNSVEHSGKQIGLITKQSNGQYHAHHSAAKLAHAAGNTFDNKDSAHQFIRNAHAKAIKSGTLSDRFLKKEEVQGKTLKQFKEGWDEMLADVKKRGETQPNGGSGKKQGSAYGGSKQKDKPEQATEKK